jgi:DNA-binding transcriptional regulator WhiA
MAKNLKGISLKGLTKVQKRQMSKHKVHHTKAHLRSMAADMRKGKTFSQSHSIAMRKVGK